MARVAGAKRAREIGRRQRDDESRRAEQRHRRGEMGEAAEGERGLHGALPLRRRRAAHIPFIPFMSMPFMSPLAAPMPTTGKSTVTAPARSKVSVTFAVSPLTNGCLRPVSMM